MRRTGRTTRLLLRAILQMCEEAHFGRHDKVIYIVGRTHDQAINHLRTAFRDICNVVGIKPEIKDKNHPHIIWWPEFKIEIHFVAVDDERRPNSHVYIDHYAREL